MPESIQKLIEREVGSWSGVSVAPHRFGGVAFNVGRRELGHLHGSRLARSLRTDRWAGINRLFGPRNRFSE